LQDHTESTEEESGEREEEANVEEEEVRGK
jgi:hypothetical protein